MIDFFTFRRNITPTLLAANWVIGSAVCVAVGWVIITQHPAQTGIMVQSVLGWALVLLGPLVLRLACEAVILPFCINETLTDISDTLDAIHDNSARGSR